MQIYLHSGFYNSLMLKKNIFGLNYKHFCSVEGYLLSYF